MEMHICQICKEPIWNFICIDCISKDIKNQLPEKLSGEFLEFHNVISKSFRFTQEGFKPCLICGVSDASSVCPVCYITEMYMWFKDNGLMKSVRKKFHFNFERYERLMKTHEIVPITEDEENMRGEEFGICDECGEYSDELISVDGRWVCRECGSEY